MTEKTPTSVALAVNPFTDDYWQAEIKQLGLKDAKFHVEHVEVDWFKLEGRCDDYLNSSIRFSNVKMPRLCINGGLWMSLTPMEIQSAALAIHRAHGHVVTGGLGLGYFTLRAAAKPEVTKVTVYEIEPLVIQWFNKVYADRPEMAKVTVVPGDMRETFRGTTCDFAFVDIYQDMLSDEVLTDAKLFRKHNEIGRYQYWGFEKVVLDMVIRKMLRSSSLTLGNDMYSYFKLWQHTPFAEENSTTLGQLYNSYLDNDFVTKAKRALVDNPI